MNRPASISRADQFGIGIACFVLWFAASIAMLTKYLGVAPSFLASVVALVGILAGVHWISHLDVQRRSTFTTNYFVVLWIAGVALFAILYPLAHGGLVGPGSDREDAINRGLQALLHGEFSYYARTYLGNKFAVMPGAFLMAAPFYAAGGAALQNPFWLAVFLWFCMVLFQENVLALFYVAIFFFVSPAALDDFVVGGDSTVNTMYVIVATGIALWVIEYGRTRRVKIFSALFLGAALAARPIYAVAIPALGAYALQRRGFRWAIGFSAVATATALAIVLPFYLYDPSNFTPIAEVTGKLRWMPQALKPAIATSVIGLAFSCAGFFKPLHRIDVYGVMAFALVPVLIPPMVFAVASHGWGADVLIPTSYGTPIAMFGGLWLIDHLKERAA